MNSKIRFYEILHKSTRQVEVLLRQKQFMIYTKLISPDRRFVHGNDICMYSIACIGRKRGKTGQALGPESAFKMGQLTLGKRSAKAGVHTCRRSRHSK
jgi:hypothetical protein